MTGLSKTLRTLNRQTRMQFAVVRPFPFSRCQAFLSLPSRSATTLADAAPRIAQPSLWKSIVPKAFRGEGQPSPRSNKPKSSQEWNPFTVYIFMFLLIGSNAINLIGLRNDLLNFSQKTERQIALLGEVIRKVHDGEDVDIAAVLGKGNLEAEQDWEETINEVSSPDTLYEKDKQKLAEIRQKVTAAQDRRKQARETEPVESTADKATSDESTRRRVGFY